MSPQRGSESTRSPSSTPPLSRRSTATVLAVAALIVTGAAAQGMSATGASVTGASVTSTTTPAPTGAAVPAGSGRRYLDRVFAEMTSRRDLVYREAPADGVPTDLLLDFYEPAGDPAAERPLVVWLHGAGPASNDKADPVDVEIVSRFVSHGAVVASINYRAGTPQAAQDARVAVEWLRERASEFGIDTDRVAMGGSSAGAITSLNAALAPDITLGEPPSQQRVGAVISLAGTGPLGVAQPGEPPVFMAHGFHDEAVAFESAQGFCDEAVSSGVACELHGFDADHIGLLFHADEIEGLLTPWLFEVLSLAGAQDPPRAPVVTTTTSTSTPPETTTSSPKPVPEDRPPVPSPPASPFPRAPRLVG